MNGQQRLHNAVGLCRKAGKCATGDFAAEKCVRAGRAKLVLVDVESSEATKARYRRLCERFGIPMREAERLGMAIGDPARRIVAVTDAGFTNMIMQVLAAEPRDEQRG